MVDILLRLSWHTINYIVKSFWNQRPPLQDTRVPLQFDIIRNAT